MVTTAVEDGPPPPPPLKARRWESPKIPVRMDISLFFYKSRLLPSPWGTIWVHERVIASPGEWQRSGLWKLEGWVVDDFGPLLVIDRYLF